MERADRLRASGVRRAGERAGVGSAGGAEADEDGAGGVGGDAGFQGERAQLVGAAGVGAGGRRHVQHKTPRAPVVQG